MPVILLGPYLPVGERPPHVRVRPLADDQLLSVRRDVAEPAAHADPVRQDARSAWRHRDEVETHCAVDRTLFDRVPSQLAVLGVDPRSRGAAALLAVGPRVNSESGARVAADQEVAVGLVSDHTAMAGIVGDGVPDVPALDIPVVVTEHTSGREARRPRDFEVADEPVAGEVDEVLELDGDAEP